MKKVSLLIAMALGAQSVFAAPPVRPKETTPRVETGREPVIVKTYRERLTQAGVAGYRAEGMSALARSNPEMTQLITNVGTKLGERPVQENIKTDVPFFTELAKSVDVNAAHAAELRADMTVRLGVNGEKLLQAKEAAVSVLGEVANAGSRANKEKALEVLETLSNTSLAQVKNEADATARISELEGKLGVKIDDYIKRCLELMKR